jgi:hypothetical protein
LDSSGGYLDSYNNPQDRYLDRWTQCAGSQ